MSLFAWRKLLNRVFKIGRHRRAPELFPPFLPRVEPLEERWVPSISPTGQSISFIEGANNPVLVATFTDDTPSPAASYNASINWGDGASSGGVVSLLGGTYFVTGSHAYVEETPLGSPQAITVVVNETVGALDNATASSTGTVADAALTPLPVTFAATEGSSFAGTVASFTDANPNATIGDFTASVAWGDGSTTAGTVSASGGTFSVSGTHTYAEDGPYAVNVIVADVGGASTTVASTANIAEATVSLNVGAAINATEGVAVSSFQVATFSDPGSNDPASDFSATIVWGDGTTDTGTISGSNGSYTVTASHTYADELSGTYAVTVSEPEANFTVGPMGAAVNVGEGDVLAAANSQPTVTGTEGTQFTGDVAVFTNTGYPTNDPADFNASIDWGDGSTDTGNAVTITSDGAGNFTVSGSHIYADEYAGSIVVTLSDDTPGTATATATNTNVAIGEADVLSGTGTTISPLELNAFTGDVATFTDTNAGATAGDFSATIDWGDGTTTAGTVSGSVGGPFTVSGTNTYAEDGPYDVIVTLTDDKPGTASATANSTANVLESTLSMTSQTIATTEGQSFNGIVATATDPGSPDDSSAYTASIDWGDGTTDTGSISGSAGDYTISGTHAYADEGSYTATVTFFENDDPGFPISVGDSVTVAEGDNLAAAASQPSVTGTEGVAFTGDVAVFTDTAYPTNDPADFSASIDWGDGTTDTGSAVTIASDGAGNFTVSGSHKYADEYTGSIIVTLSDDAPGASSATATNTNVTIGEGDVLSGTGTPIATTEGSAFSGDVATFTDTLAGATAGDFSASIDWGDGATTAGSVSGPVGGPFTVSGSHTYDEDGTFTIGVTLSDDAPGTATATASTTADVAEGDLTGTGISSFTAEGTSNSGYVATFSDPGSTDGAGAFTATIDWGDGIITAGSVTGGAGVYTVSGTHTYADEGSVTVTATLTETGVTNGTATATTTGTVIEADNLTAAAVQPTLSATEGQVASGAIAYFTDTAYPNNDPTDFAASIDWGDGTTDTGNAVTITSDGAGNFTVSGSHKYADEGNFAPIIVLADDTPGTSSATAGSTVTVAEADSLTGTFVPTTIPEDTAGTNVVAAATFTDTYGSTVIFQRDRGYDNTHTDSGIVSGSVGGPFTVSGVHSYADEALTLNVTVTLTDVDDDASGQATATATASGTITTTEGDILAATPTPFSGTEGVPLNVQVASFTTTFVGNTASDFSALILWGDNTSSPGTVSGGAGSFVVTGSHLYFDEGVFTPTVFIADDAPGTATATAVGSANIAEGDVLTPIAMTFTPTETQVFSGAVARFTNTGYPSNPASDFSATINWGDGTSSAGVVVGDGFGHYTINGIHTYADEGALPVTVVLTDEFPGTVSSTAISTADVAEADALTAGAASVSATEGTPFSGAVATFSNTNTISPAGDFTATIDWGDGTSTPGSVTGAAGSYTVSGTHTYTDEGSFAISVVLTDDAPGTASATAVGTATVAEGDVLTAVSASVSAIEDTAFNGVVATFTNANASNDASDFNATIDWGDGTSSAGIVSNSGTTYSVSGGHTYGEEGTFGISVVLADDAPGTAAATATGTATVGEGDVLTGGSASVAATEFTPFSGAVATFTNTNLATDASDFTATIDWGDGTNTPGVVSDDGAGNYTVSGSHTYTDEGSFALSVVLIDDAPGTATATAVGSADVAEADDLAAVGAAVTATEGTTFNGAVATFTNTNLAADASDFTATIDWGDGSNTSGVVTDDGAGNYTVSGSHMYTEEGTFPISVVLSDDAPGSAAATAAGTADVAEGDALTAVSASVSATEGASFSGTVATFTNSNTANSASDFTATIDWGDGTNTPGVVTDDGAGNYTVSGSHSYAEEGSFTIGVTLSEDAPGTAAATATGTADVAEGDVLTAVSASVAATEATVFSGAVAFFTNSNLANAGADFNAAIDWGDGKVTAGTVVDDGAGNYTVLASHTYADEGSFALTVIVSEDGAGTASATAIGTADVAEGDSLTAGSVSVSATEGTSFTGTVATFTNSNLSNDASDFTATIDWGDGTSSPGVVSNSSGAYTVSGSHIYADEGDYAISVVLSDDAPGTATATAAGTATVAEGDDLTAGAASVAATEGTAFSGTVATFANSNLSNDASDFTATIDWGDGTSSPGVVSNSGGEYTVSGSHIYADEGDYAISVVLSDDAPGTATATAVGTATVVEGDDLTAGAASVAATEGTAFSGAVATFANSNLTNDSSDFTATIDWGDGTSSPGVVSNSGGAYTVSGSHTYTDEGAFAISVVLTEDAQGTASATATGTADVAEGDVLDFVSATASPTEGVPFTSTVVFSDTNLTAVASDFVATVDWGDGSGDPATVTGGNGLFTVTASHTYGDEGDFNITVVLSDDAPGTASATYTGTLTVAEGDVLTAGAATVAATEGTAFSGAVATFTNTNVGNSSGDFTATIDWGDGTTSPGIVSNSGGAYTVSGSHTYTDEGSFAISVILSDDAPGTATATAVGTATVAEGDVLTAGTASVAATEGAAFSRTVATFTNTNLGTDASDFTATIDWGDGSTTAGSVSGSAGGYTVSGSHTYADEGSFAISVVLTDDAPGTASATATGTAAVAEADVLTAGTVSIATTEGTVFNGTVATFTNTNLVTDASDFTATIDWGDGSTTTGSVSGSAGAYTVSGSHTYADEGSFNLSVVLSDDAPGTASATATGTADVAEADVLDVVAAVVSATEGTTFTGTVANFTSTQTTTPASDFTATINWGDGTTTTGTVAGASGAFSVAGSHLYAEEGNFDITVTVTENAPGNATASKTATTAVADPPVVANSFSLILTAGVDDGTLTLGTFTDPGGPTPNSTAPNGVHYTADIAWGDGTGDRGMVIFDAATNSFSVLGSHVYGHEGFYNVTLTIHHDAAPDTVVTNIAVVIDAPVFLTSFTPPIAVRGSFLGQIATFVDYDGSGTSDGFRATINWGDGTTSLGTIVETGVDGFGHANFTVSAFHFYASVPTGAVSIEVKDLRGATTTSLADDGSSALLETVYFDAATGTFKLVSFRYS